MKTNQGSMVSFEEAMKMAYEDMYDDTRRSGKDGK